jgi:hypothetical protein
MAVRLVKNIRKRRRIANGHQENRPVNRVGYGEA